MYANCLPNLCHSFFVLHWIASHCMPGLHRQFRSWNFDYKGFNNLNLLIGTCLLYHYISFIPLHFFYTTTLPFIHIFLNHYIFLYHYIFFKPLHLIASYVCFINLGPKYGLYSQKFYRPLYLQIGTPNKIFSHSTHPHSNHFTYKYQNFSYFYFKYMVHKPHTFQVLVKLVYGL